MENKVKCSFCNKHMEFTATNEKGETFNFCKHHFEVYNELSGFIAETYVISIEKVVKENMELNKMIHTLTKKIHVLIKKIQRIKEKAKIEADQLHWEYQENMAKS